MCRSLEVRKEVVSVPAIFKCAVFDNSVVCRIYLDTDIHRAGAVAVEHFEPAAETYASDLVVRRGPGPGWNEASGRVAVLKRDLVPVDIDAGRGAARSDSDAEVSAITTDITNHNIRDDILCQPSRGVVADEIDNTCFVRRIRGHIDAVDVLDAEVLDVDLLPRGRDVIVSHRTDDHGVSGCLGKAVVVDGEVFDDDVLEAVAAGGSVQVYEARRSRGECDLRST